MHKINIYIYKIKNPQAEALRKALKSSIRHVSMNPSMFIHAT